MDFAAYNPYDWYWKADDGRLYSSKTQTVTSSSGDVEGMTSVWPRDLAGNQTDAALQEVLAPYNLFVTLQAYAANARWTKEQGGLAVTLASGSVTVKTDDRAQAKINGVRIAADNNNLTGTTPWVLADGTIQDMDATDITAMSDQLQQFIGACFTTFKTVVDDINAGTITTHAQIDQAFAQMSLK